MYIYIHTHMYMCCLSHVHIWISTYMHTCMHPSIHPYTLCIYCTVSYIEYTKLASPRLAKCRSGPSQEDGRCRAGQHGLRPTGHGPDAGAVGLAAQV